MRVPTVLAIVLAVPLLLLAFAQLLYGSIFGVRGDLSDVLNRQRTSVITSG